MKKILFTTALLTIVLTNTSFAQSLSDAVRYTDEENFSSARVMALGGAFTALGGDPGSIIVNPAGTAVANYASFSITPALNISVANPGMTKVQFDSPNIAAVFDWDTNQARGIRRFSFAINANTSAVYGFDLSYSGKNSTTSLSNYMAAYADGLYMSQLKDPDVYGKGIVPWPVLTAWKSEMIDPNVNSDNNTHYWGMSQNMWGRMAAPVKESYDRTTKGFKRDIVLSGGFDLADIFYFGASLGISTIKYTADETVGEEAVDRSLFPVSRYKSATYNNVNNASASGIYGQFGVIVVPIPQFRIGVSYKTPTQYKFKDEFQCYGKTVRRYDSEISDSYISYTTEQANDGYLFVVPGLWNFGAAGIIANRLVLSFDYSMRDYRNGIYKSLGGRTTEYDGDEDYPGINKLIKSELNFRHTIKAGAEVRATENFSARLGYNYTIDPRQMEFCCGLGYDSHTFLYVDLAFKYTRCATEYVHLYGDYLGFDSDAKAQQWAGDLDNPAIYNDLVVLEAPTISFIKNRYTVALTIGFKF